MNIRDGLLCILSFPLLVFMAVFDVIKTPVVVFLLIPMFIFLWMMVSLKEGIKIGNDFFVYAVKLTLFLGICIYFAIVWDKEIVTS